MIEWQCQKEPGRKLFGMSSKHCWGLWSRWSLGMLWESCTKAMYFTGQGRKALCPCWKLHLRWAAPLFQCLGGKNKPPSVFSLNMRSPEDPIWHNPGKGTNTAVYIILLTPKSLVQDLGEIFTFKERGHFRLWNNDPVTHWFNPASTGMQRMAFPIQGPHLPNWSVTVTRSLGTPTIWTYKQQVFAVARFCVYLIALHSPAQNVLALGG